MLKTAAIAVILFRCAAQELLHRPEAKSKKNMKNRYALTSKIKLLPVRYRSIRVFRSRIRLIPGGRSSESRWKTAGRSFWDGRHRIRIKLQMPKRKISICARCIGIQHFIQCFCWWNSKNRQMKNRRFLFHEKEPAGFIRLFKFTKNTMACAFHRAQAFSISSVRGSPRVCLALRGRHLLNYYLFRILGGIPWIIA